MIEINSRLQRLILKSGENRVLRTYDVSTSKNGLGQIDGSFCTPRGMHVIRAKIGHGSPANTVFVGRRPTGEIFSDKLKLQYPERDWILSRIMWLSGCEVGINRLGKVDTMRRYIYFHGSPDSVEMGRPGSMGCIRMRNKDIIELFKLVSIGTRVNIT